ncbi:MAG: hypothetical protein V1755_08715 [Chloroflexota bacterium]
MEQYVGNVYGYLTIIKEITPYVHNRMVECICVCGKTKTIRLAHLISSSTKSCGCMRGEMLRRHALIHGHKSSNGASVEYVSWLCMKSRCMNPNNPEWHNYGGRGICVCDKWINNFKAFFEDVGQRPKGKYSLDRINTNDGYCPGNVRWATAKQQANNTRVNKIIRWNGIALTLAEASEIYGIGSDTISYRLRKGWSIEKALTKKPRRCWRTKSNVEI